MCKCVVTHDFIGFQCVSIRVIRGTYGFLHICCNSLCFWGFWGVFGSRVNVFWYPFVSVHFVGVFPVSGLGWGLFLLGTLLGVVGGNFWRVLYGVGGFWWGWLNFRGR